MARKCLNNMINDIRNLTVRALADEYGFNFEEAIELLNNKFRIETDYYNKFYNTEIAMTKEEHEQHYGENQDNNDISLNVYCEETIREALSCGTKNGFTRFNLNYIKGYFNMSNAISNMGDFRIKDDIKHVEFFVNYNQLKLIRVNN